MKLLKKYNNHKQLKASSLIESVIAMTIISICILISLNLYTTVLNSNDSIIDYKIEAEKNNILNDLENLDVSIDETFRFKKFKIEKSIEDYEENEHLKILTLSSIHQNDTLKNSYLIKIEK